MAKAKKRGPIFWIALTVLAVLTATGLRAAFDENFRDELSLYGAIFYADINKPNDAITRRIRAEIRKAGHKAGDKIPLSPEPFIAGTSKPEVLKQLDAAKYKVDLDGSLEMTRPTVEDASAPKSDTLYYGLTASEGVCDTRFEVALTFDSSNRLKEAWGTDKGGVCL